MEKRKYTLGRRAEAQDATRQRIVEATMALHEEVGPRNTTISAIAQKAGVQRLTVYRHFPDEAAVIQACSTTWLQRHPLPPIPQPPPGGVDSGWIREALHALYAYNRSTQRMWEMIHRDADDIDAVRDALSQVSQYLEAYSAPILRNLANRRDAPRELRAAVALAVSFSTWATLAGHGLGDKPISRMMSEWLATLSSNRNRNG